MLPAILQYFCTEDVWEENCFPSKLLSQIMSKPSWIWMMSAVTGWRESKTARNKLKSSASEMVSGIVQSTVVPYGFAEPMWEEGRWRVRIMGSRKQFHSQLKACCLSTTSNCPRFWVTEDMVVEYGTRDEWAVEIKKSWNKKMWKWFNWGSQRWRTLDGWSKKAVELVLD